MAEEIRQHAMMAMGKGIMPDETFGVEPLGRPVGGEENGRKKLKEHERAISRPRGFHPEPDHGEY
ncbi:MAG: hypothetical protein KGL39_20245 [Patescibacteria group bacterium]|nr:hypothetical protein [Patescibacteria group bacterium]